MVSTSEYATILRSEVTNGALSVLAVATIS